MTNDLFRDLLEGRIPMAPRDPFRFWRAGITAWQEAWLKAFMDDATEPFRRHVLNEWIIATPPPADPRARALRAKQQQGHGPAMTPLRVRGRTTHYKEKG